MLVLFWSVWAALASTSLVWTVFFVVSRGFRAQRPPLGDGDFHPFVTIQIPVFDDVVAVECVRRARALEHPADALEILIVDDSRDPTVRSALAALATDVAPTVRYLHRPHRQGFKPGALAEALPQSRGEIIVVFDSDWRPRPTFLREVLPHFRDPRVAIVQTREDVHNIAQSLVSRFASAVIFTHYRLVMRTFDRAGITFFCGTAGALRRSALEAVGGWNPRSITEDADVSMRLLRAGHRSVLVEHDTESQVPHTMRAFLAQQSRWAFGNVRIALDDPSAFSDRRLSWWQRSLAATWLFAHAGSVVTTISIVISIAMIWLAPPGWSYPWWGYVPLALWLFVCVGSSLRERGRLRDLPWIALGVFVVGMPLSIACGWQFLRAIANRPTGWTRTPKQTIAIGASE